MASVHVAESRNLRKRVALKRLLPHVVDNPEIVQSFVKEARLVANLKHTNIAQTYDFGKVGDVYFIAMELVPGPTLAQLIRQCKATVGIVPFPITLNILCQVCDALAYAHALTDEQGRPLGLIHRDVSPPNIIVSNTGTVKLIDFGVAKIARSNNQTQVGTIKGKFSYMAPEYLNGQLDSRVDLWALGAVAHELLTNRMLFDAADDLAVMAKVKYHPITPPSQANRDVPRDLDACVLTALERNPAHRWQSATAMKNALANVVTELKSEISNARMIEWIEWAFTQKPGEDPNGVSQLIQLLEKPSQPGAVSIKPSAPMRPSDPTIPQKKNAAAKERRPSTPRAGVVIIDRSSPPRRGIIRPWAPSRDLKPWLVLALAVVGLAAAIYFFGVPSALTRSF